MKFKCIEGFEVANVNQGIFKVDKQTEPIKHLQETIIETGYFFKRKKIVKLTPENCIVETPYRKKVSHKWLLKKEKIDLRIKSPRFEIKNESEQLEDLKVIHELKILPEYFGEVISGRKKFEIRKNDRGFKVGDRLILKLWSEEHGFTGAYCKADIGYITDYEQKDNYVVLSINVI